MIFLSFKILFWRSHQKKKKKWYCPAYILLHKIMKIRANIVIEFQKIITQILVQLFAFVSTSTAIQIHQRGSSMSLCDCFCLFHPSTLKAKILRRILLVNDLRAFQCRCCNVGKHCLISNRKYIWMHVEFKLVKSLEGDWPEASAPTCWCATFQTYHRPFKNENKGNKVNFL